MQSELKACPFCGSAAEIYYPFHMVGNSRQSATYRGGVRCTKCWCQGDSTSPPNKAIAAWNTRAEGDATVTGDPIATAQARIMNELKQQNDGEWQKLFWRVAKELKCLPSVFVNDNEHVVNAARAALKTSTGEGK